MQATAGLGIIQVIVYWQEFETWSFLQGSQNVCHDTK